MQATRWKSDETAPSALPHGAKAHHQLGWYVAFALLTTLAEALFLLSSMPSWMLG